MAVIIIYDSLSIHNYYFPCEGFQLRSHLSLITSLPGNNVKDIKWQANRRRAETGHFSQYNRSSLEAKMPWCWCFRTREDFNEHCEKPTLYLKQEVLFPILLRILLGRFWHEINVKCKISQSAPDEWILPRLTCSCHVMLTCHNLVEWKVEV